MAEQQEEQERGGGEDPDKEEDDVRGPSHKRLRGEDGTTTPVGGGGGGQIVVAADNNNNDDNHEEDDEDDAIRTSSLDAPTMKLSGHKGSVYAVSYNPSGTALCSGSFDKTALLWNASGSCENYNVLGGHKNAILDLVWSSSAAAGGGGGGDGEYIATASADTNVGWYDANTGQRIKRFQNHSGIVNSVDASPISPHVILSGSDDKTAVLWDARVRRGGLVTTLPHEYQVTAVAFGKTPDGGNNVYTGGIDNCIHAWDLRRVSSGGGGDKSSSNNNNSGSGGGGGASAGKVMTMKGHTDTITYLSVHPQNSHILSHSMDGSLRSYDIRPYIPPGTKRHVQTFMGATHNAEKGLLNCSWSISDDGQMVTSGSADRVVHIWDVPTGEELYYLPGHKGCVNSVVFHPKENVIASASSDKTIYVGELSS